MFEACFNHARQPSIWRPKHTCIFPYTFVSDDIRSYLAKHVRIYAPVRTRIWSQCRGSDQQHKLDLHHQSCSHSISSQPFPTLPSHSRGHIRRAGYTGEGSQILEDLLGEHFFALPGPLSGGAIFSSTGLCRILHKQRTRNTNVLLPTRTYCFQHERISTNTDVFRRTRTYTQTRTYPSLTSERD